MDEQFDLVSYSNAFIDGMGIGNQGVNESLASKLVRQEVILMQNEQQHELVAEEKKFSVKQLGVTNLGTFIENRVNNFLKNIKAGAVEVSVCVISSINKTVEVKPRMKNRYVCKGDMPSQFPYRAKTLSAFEKVNGTDVCFFSMLVQEYGIECRLPNTSRVNISRLESTGLFEPKELAASVCQEILLGYLDYVKQLGYVMVHIWMRPFKIDDDYMSQYQADIQKFPNPPRFQEWYKNMLDKAMVEGIVLDYNDILKQALEDRHSRGSDIPYFDADFWPYVFEEIIKELDQEEEENRRPVEETVPNNSMHSPKMGPDGSNFCFPFRQTKGNATKKVRPIQGNTNKVLAINLNTKIFAALEKHKDEFLVVRLHSVQSALNLGAVADPDSLLSYCNKCISHDETLYRYTVWDDYDLCERCKEKESHPHPLKQLDLGLDDKLSPSNKKPNVQNPEARKSMIQRSIQSLVHACNCKDANCRIASCQRMKRVVQHISTCQRRTNGGCPICKQLVALCCHHSKQCQEAECPVPLCFNIKQKFKQRQHQQQLQNSQLHGPRMAAMNAPSMESSLTSAQNNVLTPAFYPENPRPFFPLGEAIEAQQFADQTYQLWSPMQQKTDEKPANTDVQSTLSLSTHSKENLGLRKSISFKKKNSSDGLQKRKLAVMAKKSNVHTSNSNTDTNMPDSALENIAVEMSAPQGESRSTELNKLLETLKNNMSQLGNKQLFDKCQNLFLALNEEMNAVCQLNEETKYLETLNENKPQFDHIKNIIQAINDYANIVLNKLAPKIN